MRLTITLFVATMLISSVAFGKCQTLECFSKPKKPRVVEQSAPNPYPPSEPQPAPGPRPYPTPR